MSTNKPSTTNKKPKPFKRNKKLEADSKLKQLKVTAFFNKVNSQSCIEPASNNNNLLSIDKKEYKGEPIEITIEDDDDNDDSTCFYDVKQQSDTTKIEEEEETKAIKVNANDIDNDDDLDCTIIEETSKFTTQTATTTTTSSDNKTNISDSKLKLSIKRKYSPADFVEFEDFNYNEKVDDRRKTPFYKKIPYTRIVVDAFNFPKEESIIQHYFLSHFHADHYVGLCKSFNKPIYCSPITYRLVRLKFKVATRFLHQHELEKPFRVENAVCTFYEANHCPGAVIILFELDSGHRYLHTGDFRACPEMEQIPNIKPIDCCFLDTTFCDRTKTFPPQKEVLENTVDVCRYALKQNPRTLIVCGSYCIGKEKVFMAVAEALQLKVWCSKAKRAFFNEIQDEKLNSMLVDKQEDAKIHVLPLKMLWKRGVRKHLDSLGDHFDALVALRPSGWEWKRNKHMIPESEGNIAIYPVPYSEHSSYTDLERFIKWLRPRRIIPTVNTGDPIKRGQMNIIFKRWLKAPFINDDSSTN